MTWNAGEWFEWELPEEAWWHKDRKFRCLCSATPNIVIINFAEADEWEDATYSITAYPSGGAIMGALLASALGLNGCRKFCGALGGLDIDWSAEPKEIFRQVSTLDAAQFEVFANAMKGQKCTEVELAECRKQQADKVANFAEYQAQQNKRKGYAKAVR